MMDPHLGKPREGGGIRKVGREHVLQRVKNRLGERVRNERFLRSNRGNYRARVTEEFGDFSVEEQERTPAG